jgi:hypothetical protein
VKITMVEFLVADLNTRGELQFRQPYTYAALEQIPGAADLIARGAAAIWRSPEMFEIPLTAAPADLTLRWAACATTAGIATVRQGANLMSLTVLAGGLDSAADTATLQAFQTHLLRELHDTGVEPAFALMDLTDRPLAATINFRSPDRPTDQQIVALADRCFAAAYFRYLQLV